MDLREVVLPAAGKRSVPSFGFAQDNISHGDKESIDPIRYRQAGLIEDVGRVDLVVCMTLFLVSSTVTSASYIYTPISLIPIPQAIARNFFTKSVLKRLCIVKYIVGLRTNN